MQLLRMVASRSWWSGAPNAGTAPPLTAVLVHARSTLPFLAHRQGENTRVENVRAGLLLLIIVLHR